MSRKILMSDPGAAYRECVAEYDDAWRRVMESGWYILGPQLQEFEREFADAIGVRETVGVANGTEAIELPLRALGIGAGDLVLVPSHTAVATAFAVTATGAKPVWVDVDPSRFTITAETLRSSWECLRRSGLEERVRAVVAVHLYGHPVDMDAVGSFCAERGLLLVEDCAQAHGAAWNGKTVGSFGTAGAFSFYPTKNLPAFGDGGAVVTDDANLTERMRRMRQYGWRVRYVSEDDGINSRLDELQAALLRVGLSKLPDWNERRRSLAAIYDRRLACLPVVRPCEEAGARHVYHQYTIRVKERDALKVALEQSGISSAVLYPMAVHQQPRFLDLCPVAVSLDGTEQAIDSLLCLPIYPQLPPDDVERICDAIEHHFASNDRTSLR